MNKALFVTLLLVALSAVAVSSKKVEASGNDCGICTMVATYIDDIIQSNKSITAIEAELDQVCTLIPGSFQSICTTLINNYLEKFIAQETPAVICGQVGFCPAPSAPKISVAGSNVPCALCTYVVSAAENYASSNSTEQEILGFLENDCKVLGSLATACQGLIELYGPAIIQDIFNKQTPSQICTEIKLCTAEQASMLLQAAPVAPVEDDFGCPVCKWIVSQIESYVSQNQTEQEIINSLESGCSVIGFKSWIEICQTIVAQYAPELITSVINAENPTTACTQVGLCGNSTTTSSSSSSSSSTSATSSSSGSGSGSSSGSGSGSGSSGITGTGSGSAISGTGSGSSGAAEVHNERRHGYGFNPKSKVRVH